MNTLEIQKYKTKLKITKRQQEILIGLLLGDGHLETLNKGRTFRLKVEHSIAQLDYVEWLYHEFREWIRSPIYRKEKNGRQYVGFTTYTHAAFRFLAQQFYKEREKVVPKIIGKLLSPLSLAVWFMDDGSRKSLKHYTYILHTYGFSRCENEILKDALSKKFGVETSIHRNKEVYWRLYILGGESAERFTSLVGHMVERFPSMAHKLSNKKPKK